MPNNDGKEIQLPQTKDAKPEKQISRFGYNFTMYRVDQFGNRITEPVLLVTDGPAKGFCKVDMVGYAMVPLEEFEGFWRRRRAIRMIKKGGRVIRGQIAKVSKPQPTTNPPSEQ